MQRVGQNIPLIATYIGILTDQCNQVMFSCPLFFVLWNHRHRVSSDLSMHVGYVLGLCPATEP